MADLIEKDPCLTRIIDPDTTRSLLDDAHPLEAVLGAAKSITLKLRIENGVEAPIELTVTSDRDWLQLKSGQLSLMGGEVGECQLQVHSQGDGEFANLCFSWQGSAESYKEYVLVWRKLPQKDQPKTKEIEKPKSQGLEPGEAPRPVWL